MFHAVLKSQLARCTGEDGQIDVQMLCQLVDRTYLQFDAERTRSDRATQLMIEEVEAADTKRQGLLDRLRLEHMKLDIALEHMAHGLAMFDAGCRLVIGNKTYLSGIDHVTAPDDMSFAESLALFKPKVATFDQPLDDIPREMAAGTPTERTVQLVDGRILHINFQPLEQGGWVQVFRDVTKERHSENRIRYLAEHDPLTGLSNRTVFGRTIFQGLSRLSANAPLSVLCIDLDHFKAVNDTLGHPVGDELLRVVADRLRSVVGSSGTIARLGGDEFAILYAAQPHQPQSLAAQAIEALQQPYMIGSHHIVIGASIGIATAPTDGDTDDLLMRNADIALYRAKANGRGVYQQFEAGMDEAILLRRQNEVELRRAVVQGEFELFYQPLLDLRSQCIRSCEALIRWNHPTRGLVSPDNFIPLAEEIGLIVEIGEWTLLKACQEAISWPPEIGVAVNVSPTQFCSLGLVSAVKHALKQSGLDAKRLELEITETVLLSDTDRTLEVLHELRRLGVRIAMDDFGTGYSSLSYLRRFPFDKVKIDRSFINDIAKDAESSAIVRSVIQLANALGMSTTAEGVEHLDQSDILGALNCREIQGYLISRPVPVERLPALLARQVSKANAA